MITYLPYGLSKGNNIWSLLTFKVTETIAIYDYLANIVHTICGEVPMNQQQLNAPLPDH